MTADPVRTRGGRAAEPATADIVAVILNWRTANLTIRAAQALMADGLPADRVVVVDNCSGDGVAEIRAALPESTLIALDENVGFARGNNIGAAAMTAGAYLFVNSDAFLRTAGTLAALARALRRPGVGIVVPRLVNEDLTLQPSVRAFLRPWVAALAATGLDRLVPDDSQPRLGRRWSHRKSRSVQFATGAVMLVHARAWSELGGFDEAMFIYGEDIDLAWRARAGGWSMWFAADAEFVHIGNASAGAAWDEERRWERMAAAEARVVRDHVRPAEAALTLAIVRAGLAVRAALYRAIGLDARMAVLRGLRRGYRSGRR